ncbi:Ba20 [Baboon cytomegalovirus]|nr:Ba20 [Baboon cytomegalovirus]
MFTFTFLIASTQYSHSSFYMPTCTPKLCCVGDEVVLESHIPSTCSVMTWYRHKNYSDILLCRFAGAYVTIHSGERISSTCSWQSFIFHNIQLPSTGTYYTVGNSCNHHPTMSACYNVTVHSRSTTPQSLKFTSVMAPMIQRYTGNNTQMIQQYVDNTQIDRPLDVNGAWGLVIVALLMLWVAIEFRLPQKMLRYFNTRFQVSARSVQTV